MSRRVHLVRKSRGPDGAAETACGHSVRGTRSTFIRAAATCAECLPYAAAPWVAWRDTDIPPPPDATPLDPFGLPDAEKP